MKKALGILLIAVAVCLFIGGVAGGILYFFASTIMAIMDAINAFKSPDPVTFWQVAAGVFWWFFREIIAIVIVIVSWTLGLASGAGGYALLTGKKKKSREERVMDMMSRAMRI